MPDPDISAKDPLPPLGDPVPEGVQVYLTCKSPESAERVHATVLRTFDHQIVKTEDARAFRVKQVQITNDSIHPAYTNGAVITVVEDLEHPDTGLWVPCPYDFEYTGRRWDPDLGWHTGDVSSRAIVSAPPHVESAHEASATPGPVDAAPGDTSPQHPTDKERPTPTGEPRGYGADFGIESSGQFSVRGMMSDEAARRCGLSFNPGGHRETELVKTACAVAMKAIMDQRDYINEQFQARARTHELPPAETDAQKDMLRCMATALTKLEAAQMFAVKGLHTKANAGVK